MYFMMAVKHFAKKCFWLISGQDSVKESQKLGNFGNNILQNFLQKCVPNEYFNHSTCFVCSQSCL